MISALKAVVVPRLRESGFLGSFPHFRRPKAACIDLLTFQFDKKGGGFLVEIAQCPVDGITTHWGKHIGPDKVTAWDVTSTQRVRLKPHAGSNTDSWFRYDPPLAAKDAFTNTAQSVLPFLTIAEKMFSDFKASN
jgi:hypothetical protein